MSFLAVVEVFGEEPFISLAKVTEVVKKLLEHEARGSNEVFSDALG